MMHYICQNSGAILFSSQIKQSFRFLFHSSKQDQLFVICSFFHVYCPKIWFLTIEVNTVVQKKKREKKQQSAIQKKEKKTRKNMNAINLRCSKISLAFLSNKQTHTCSISCHCSFKCRRTRLRERQKEIAHTHTHTQTQQKTRGREKKMNSSQLRDGESNIARA